MGLCRGVLQSMVSNTGQKILPSAPPSQSFIAGRHEISVKKFNTACNTSAVTVKPENSQSGINKVQGVKGIHNPLVLSFCGFECRTIRNDKKSNIFFIFLPFSI